MKTTLDLERDVVLALNDLASSQNKTAEEVVSELVRSVAAPKAETEVHNGIRVFAKVKGGQPITPDMVNRLIDELM